MIHLYARQDNIALNIPKKMIIIGAGGIGSHLAIQAAMIGVEELFIIDADDLELHNLNRTLYTIDQVGELKVDALKDLLQKHRFSNTAFTTFKLKNQLLQNYDILNSESDLFFREEKTLNIVTRAVMLEGNIFRIFGIPKEEEEEFLIVDTTDGYFNSTQAKSYGLTKTYAKLNYDGTKVAITLNPYAIDEEGNPKLYFIDEIEQRGYQIIPSYYLAPNILVSMFLHRLLTEKERETRTLSMGIDLTNMMEMLFNDFTYVSTFGEE